MFVLIAAEEVTALFWTVWDELTASETWVLWVEAAEAAAANIACKF